MKNHVRSLREQLSMTQGELAKIAGVSRQAINAIETGKYDPSIGLAFTLAQIFEKTIEEVFIFNRGDVS